MLLLEHDITKKGRMNEFSMQKFEADNDKEYEVEAIQNSAVYDKEVDKHLLKLYHLVA